MLRNFQTSLPVLVIIHSLQLQILRVCFASRRYTLSILQNMVLVPEVSDSTKDDWGEWQYSTNFQQIFQISICKMPKSKYYQVKVTVRRFHMNGNNIGLSPQMLQWEPPYQTQSFTLGIKGSVVPRVVLTATVIKPFFYWQLYTSLSI